MKRKQRAKIQHAKKCFKLKKQQLMTAISIVKQANQLQDPFDSCSQFKTYTVQGFSVKLYIKRVTDLEDSVRDWIFVLTTRNMQAKYEQCSWGWNDAKKLKELMNSAAWYLIAENEGSPVAFSHFRFDIDQDIEVLYCYELQLEPAVRNKGLGKFMMQILELLAFKNDMKKVVLTVLKNNSFSNFFKTIGYVLDESSPVDTLNQTFSYEILSKCKEQLFKTM